MGDTRNERNLCGARRIKDLEERAVFLVSGERCHSEKKA